MKLNYYSLWYFGLAILSGIFFGFAGTIMKKGVMHFQLTSNVFQLVWRVLTTKYIMLSLFFSVTGTILYMILIKKAEIIPSVIIIQSVLFVSTVFFAHMFFNESVNLSKIIALLLITAGIVVLLTGK